MKLKIPYLVAAVVATSSLFYLANTPGLSAAQLVSFDTTTGQTVDLASPKGKTRLISFWAPDCPISERDTSSLSHLQKQFADTEFEVMAVAMPYARQDDIQSRMDVIDYPVAHDTSGSISEGFPGVRFTPTTFLIDGSGKIIWRHVGALDTAETATHITRSITLPPDQLEDQLAKNASL